MGKNGAEEARSHWLDREEEATTLTGSNVSTDTTAKDVCCTEPWKTNMNSSLSGALTKSRYFMYTVRTLKTTLY